MIYISSACIKRKRIVEIIEELIKHNIRNIELSGGTDNYDGLESDLKQLKDLYHLRYVCHAYFPPPKIPFVVNLASCDDLIYKQSIDHYVQCIDLLKRIECKVLSIHAGFLVEIGVNEIGGKLNDSIIYDEDEAYDRFCYAYERIAQLCKKNDINLYLENNVLSLENYSQFDYHNYVMMTDFNTIMKMKERLEFNLLLDLGHLHVSAHTLKLDYAQECYKLKPYVKWIHMSENNGFCDEHKPLKRSSRIMEEFEKMLRPDIGVTLETVGNIEEILMSLDILSNICNIN